MKSHTCSCRWLTFWLAWHRSDHSSDKELLEDSHRSLNTSGRSPDTFHPHICKESSCSTHDRSRDHEEGTLKVSIGWTNWKFNIRSHNHYFCICKESERCSCFHSCTRICFLHMYRLGIHKEYLQRSGNEKWIYLTDKREWGHCIDEHSTCTHCSHTSKDCCSHKLSQTRRWNRYLRKCRLLHTNLVVLYW